MWITFTLTRLDRLHARVDAAQAALDAQLVRRAAALLQVAETADNGVAAVLRHRRQGALPGRGPAAGRARNRARVRATVRAPETRNGKGIFMIISSRALKLACVSVSVAALAACGGSHHKKAATPVPTT